MPVRRCAHRTVSTSGFARQTTPRPDARCRGVGVERGARRHGCAGRGGGVRWFADQTSSPSAMGGLCGFPAAAGVGGSVQWIVVPPSPWSSSRPLRPGPAYQAWRRSPTETRSGLGLSVSGSTASTLRSRRRAARARRTRRSLGHRCRSGRWGARGSYRGAGSARAGGQPLSRALHRAAPAVTSVSLVFRLPAVSVPSPPRSLPAGVSLRPETAVPEVLDRLGPAGGRSEGRAV